MRNKTIRDLVYEIENFEYSQENFDFFKEQSHCMLLGLYIDSIEFKENSNQMVNFESVEEFTDINIDVVYEKFNSSISSIKIKLHNAILNMLKFFLSIWNNFIRIVNRKSDMIKLQKLKNDAEKKIEELKEDNELLKSKLEYRITQNKIHGDFLKVLWKDNQELERQLILLRKEVSYNKTANDFIIPKVMLEVLSKNLTVEQYNELELANIIASPNIIIMTNYDPEALMKLYSEYLKLIKLMENTPDDKNHIAKLSSSIKRLKKKVDKIKPSSTIGKSFVKEITNSQELEEWRDKINKYIWALESIRNHATKEGGIGFNTNNAMKILDINQDDQLINSSIKTSARTELSVLYSTLWQLNIDLSKVLKEFSIDIDNSIKARNKSIEMIIKILDF